MKYQNIIIALIFVFVIIGCKSETNTQNENHKEEIVDDAIHLTAKQFDASKFELGKIQKMTFYESLPVNGLLHLPDKNRAVVASFVGGYVNDMSLTHGQKVSKGQRLFSITNPDLIDLQQEFLELQGHLKFLRDDYQRENLLAEQNISAKKNLVKAESELNIHEARYAGIKEKLRLYGLKTEDISATSLISVLPVYSPISGNVNEINIVKGSYLNPKDIAMEIRNTNHLHLEIKVLEKDIYKLKLEQQILFRFINDTSNTYKATVYLIDNRIGESKLVNVHCHLEKENDPSMLEGMFVQGDVVLKSYEGWGIPEEALIKEDNQSYVLVKSKDKNLDFEKVEVIAGRIENEFVEVVESKLDTTDQILIKGAYYITGEK